MHVEYLSDHVGDLVKESHQRLAHLGGQEMYWLDALRDADTDRLIAERSRSPWRRLLNIAPPGYADIQNRIVDADRRLQSIRSEMTEVENEAGAREGGAEGEKRFESELDWMSDDWRMFRGYRNKRGEADAVLVGPDGIWTVEVKNWKVRLWINGDDWICEETGGRGRRSVRQAADRTGRPWGRQVREIAQTLAQRLHRKGFFVPVHTAVVILNDQAVIESCRQPGVDFVGTSTGVFADRMADLAIPLAVDDVASIQRLVRNDHRYWEDKTAQASMKR